MRKIMRVRKTTTEKRSRSRFDIIYDMLRAVQNNGGKILPTHLLRKSNLSHARMKRYVSELEQNGLLKTEQENGKTAYALTEKGYEFIANYAKMKAFAEAFGLTN